MYHQQVINAAKLAIRTSGFAHPLRKLIRNQPLQKAIEIGRKSGWDEASEWLLSKEGCETLSDQQIHSSLRSVKNLDIETELLLTSLRKKLLFTDEKRLAGPEIMQTICSLANQANINEYVWYVSDDEADLLQQLQRPADVSGNIESVSWSNIARLAMYYLPSDIFSNLENIQKSI